METIEFEGWILASDAEATRRAYAQPDDTEPCSCAYCRNFRAARSIVSPAALLRLYERLMIPVEREAESYELGPVGTGTYLYGCWHHFVGRVLRDPGTVVDLGSGCGVHFVEAATCAAAAFSGSPLVQVELIIRVPWVIEEPYPFDE